MTIREQLKKDFEELLSKTDKETFTKAKLKLYETIFLNHKNVDDLFVVLGAFEMSCNHFMYLDFSEKIKELIVADFQNTLYTIDAFQLEN